MTPVIETRFTSEYTQRNSSSAPFKNSNLIELKTGVLAIFPVDYFVLLVLKVLFRQIVNFCRAD